MQNRDTSQMIYRPHFFTLKELCTSQRAKDLHIVNVPDFEDISKLLYLCEHVLDPLRVMWGKPLWVSSGFRCSELNEAIGGASKSQHMCEGPWAAADIDPGDISQVKALAALAQKLPLFDQMIIEGVGGSWLHISIRLDDKNRRQVLNID
jgi:uncharacterized protein YcbK (DUF882 family)